MTERTSRRRAEKSGRRAETLAGLFLRLMGYRVIATRYRTRVGEIDIVARTGTVLVFVEVKQRNTAPSEPRDRTRARALEAVDPHRLSNAARWFLMAHPRYGHLDCRFDVLVLAPWRWPYHLQNAFAAS